MKNKLRRLVALLLTLGMVCGALCPVQAAELSGQAAETLCDQSEESAVEPDESRDQREESAAEPDASQDQSQESAPEPDEPQDQSEESAAEPDEPLDQSEESAAEPDESRDQREESAAEPDASQDQSQESAPEPDESRDQSEESTAEPDTSPDQSEEPAPLAPAAAYDVSAPHVVIEQIYGSKGESELLSHDFIELYNPTEDAVNLSGWSVQYRAAGDSGAWQKLNLSGTIPAHCSFLIRCAASGASVDEQRTLERFDAQWDIPLNNKGLSVVLLSTAELLAPESVVFDNAAHAPVVNGYVDMLSVAGGSKASQIPAVYEGQVHDWQSKKNAVIRKHFRDTDDNKADTEKADYSAADVSALLPRCSADGVWGIPTDRLRKVRSRVPRFTEVYCTPESAAALSAAVEEADAALEREESDPDVLNALTAALEAAVSGLVYRHDETIAQVYLTTDDGSGTSYGAALTKEQGYVSAAAVAVDVDGAVQVQDAAAQVKIHGNSTAKKEKKPYNLKLSAKAGLFGMDKSKKWCLLADYFDPTLLRNSVAFELCRALGFPAADYRRVEVWMDGQYRGVYLLTQKVEDVVDVGEDGFLIEMDVERRQEEDEFYFRTQSGYFYRIREPESQQGADDAAARMNQVEAALADGSKAAVEALVDVESFADYYVINEFVKNPDFRKLSVYFHWRDGRLRAGPEWDNDLSLGLFTGRKLSSRGSLVESCHYFSRLIHQKWFRRLVAKRYAVLAPAARALFADGGWLDQQAAQYSEAIARNFAVWPYISETAAEKAAYEPNLAYLKGWMTQRAAWFDDYSKSLGTEIVQEDGAWYYYADGERCAAGLLLYAGDYYFAGPGGRILTGSVEVTDSNGLPLPPGTYTFAEQADPARGVKPGAMLNVPIQYEAVHQPGRAPTCIMPGMRECWLVERTGKLYADAACTKEIISAWISETGHHWTGGTAVKLATEEEDGFWEETCSGCGKTRQTPIPRLVLTPPEAVRGLVYSGRAQVLVTAGSASRGALVYSLSKNGAYSAQVPTATDAGQYRVWYKLDGDSRYAGIPPRELRVDIERAVQKTPAAPVLKKAGLTELRVKAVAGQEYSIDGGKTWQRDGRFTELHPSTRYSVVTRRREDCNHRASGASAAGVFQTMTKAAIELNSALTFTQSGSALRLRWGAVTGADRYEVWVQDGSTPFGSKPTRTVKKSGPCSVSITRLNGKKLKLSGDWRAVVKAKRGKKTLAVSLRVYAVGRRNPNYTNARRIELKTTSLSLKMGKKSKIRTKTVRISPKKRLFSKTLVREFRYVSGDETVATVDEKGRVTGVAPGRCRVYVYARNGLARWVSVQVK